MYSLTSGIIPIFEMSACRWHTVRVDDVANNDRTDDLIHPELVPELQGVRDSLGPRIYNAHLDALSRQLHSVSHQRSVARDPETGNRKSRQPKLPKRRKMAREDPAKSTKPAQADMEQSSGSKKREYRCGDRQELRHRQSSRKCLKRNSRQPAYNSSDDSFVY